jgi:hypothetical protein
MSVLLPPATLHLHALCLRNYSIDIRTLSNARTTSTSSSIRLILGLRFCKFRFFDFYSSPLRLQQLSLFLALSLLLILGIHNPRHGQNMWCLRLSVIASALFVSLTLCSFYDNPELELPPASGTPLDELKEKWDFDVSLLPHFPF